MESLPIILNSEDIFLFFSSISRFICSILFVESADTKAIIQFDILHSKSLFSNSSKIL